MIYFGPSYFGSSYFGSSYFGAPPAPSNPTLRQGFHTRDATFELERLEYTAIAMVEQPGGEFSLGSFESHADGIWAFILYTGDYVDGRQARLRIRILDADNWTELRVRSSGIQDQLQIHLVESVAGVEDDHALGSIGATLGHDCESWQIVYRAIDREHAFFAAPESIAFALIPLYTASGDLSHDEATDAEIASDSEPHWTILPMSQLRGKLVIETPLS